MTASPARRARRATEKAMRAMGVELVHREHIIAPEDMSRATLVDVIAERTALAIKTLALDGADLNAKLTVTIGEHPSFPAAITIEAKAARRQTWTKIEVAPGLPVTSFFVAPVGTPAPVHDPDDCPGCPIDHSLDAADEDER